MERMSSIELALKNEEIEMNFYLQQAQRSQNPLAKAMFQSLAGDEEEHMKRIKGLHGKLIADGSWPNDVPIEVAGTNVPKVLADNAQGNVEHNSDDINALEKAIAFEATGAKFYADLAALCKNQMEKNFFDFLAQIERAHHLSLTDSLAYLKDPEGWSMQQERSGLDGA